MAKKKGKRAVYSIQKELVQKSREAALSAVQIFNNPQMSFKSEIFIVTMNIAWTYLLHAYYRKNNVEYRHYKEVGKVKRYEKTKGGAHKYWELKKCLENKNCTLDKNTKNNLKFLMGIRHEIEHKMTTKIDGSLSAKFQACVLNFNREIKNFFGENFGIDKHLTISLQFSSFNKDQVSQLQKEESLPAHIDSYTRGFEKSLSQKEYDHPQFSYRVLFVPKTANRKGQADQVIEFVKADSDIAKNTNKTYALIKETEKDKYTASQIVDKMKVNGFKKFRIYEHTQLWKSEGAKKPGKGLGVLIVNSWYWYESWLDFVGEHCAKNQKNYS